VKTTRGTGSTISLLLFFLLISPAAGAAGSETGPVISGTISSFDTNEPLAGVLVRLAGTACWVHTDSAGKFALRPMAIGPQLVIVEVSGYIPMAYPVTVSQSEAVVPGIRLQRYIPPPPPLCSSHRMLRVRGGICYFLMEDYNRAFGGYRYYAPTRSYEEIEGSSLHLGSGVELEGVLALSETWQLGLGIGLMRGANSYRANANFIGPFLHSYSREFTTYSVPVFATVFYNRRYSSHRLYFGLGVGYYPVFARLVEEDVFQESGPINSTGNVRGGGIGFHQVYAVEYFLGRRLAVAGEIRARLASISGLTGVRKVVSSRGRFEENVRLYMQDFPKDNYEVMVLLPETGQSSGPRRAKQAAISFTGVQMLIAFNLYL
jgi:hypothetical protein